MPFRHRIAALLVLSCSCVASAITPARATDHDFLKGREFTQTNVFSNVAGQALELDPDLADAWGIAFVPNGPFWVNATGSGLSLLYDGSGAKIPARFIVPAAPGAGGPSAPTGIAWNPSSGFLVPGTRLPSIFLMATLNGTIAAWAGGLPANPNDALLAVDSSKLPGGASYTGLAFATTANGAFIYAPNIATGRIDVFDSTFAPANARLAGSFQDPAIPAGYTPFNLLEVNGTLVVTFARQNSTRTFVSPGAGAGYVSIFDTDGRLLQHVGEAGLLNAPWGIAQAPTGFGKLSGKLLIGNFGDGHILAFTPGRPDPEPMLNQAGAPLSIPGLWALTFGGASKSDPRDLYFSAGPQGGAEGLVGILQPDADPAP